MARVKSRGPYGDRRAAYEEARRLREEGQGYRTIANQIGDVPWGTVRNWVKDIPIDKQRAYECSIAKRQIPIDKLKAKGAIRTRLIAKRGARCEGCGLTDWLGETLVLELHHIDGHPRNHAVANLRLLCPNCHSQTPNYRNMKR